MPDMNLFPILGRSYVYRCPHEGPKCPGNKHCHILETACRLDAPITVFIQCPVRHKQKIAVQIGN